jgi:hypothetical protein
MYERLCASLADAGYISRQFAHYPALDLDSKIPFVILRHDVDRYPRTAIRLAEIEHDHGLTATYFFRLVPSAFDTAVIKRVAELGMEIGYHYETIDRADGDLDRAFELVQEDLARLREFGPVISMAMHGNPLTPYDNRDLWKKFDYREVGIEVAAYFTVDYSRIRYFTDTGRNWDTDRGNLYDKVSHQADARLRSTDDLIEFLKESPAHTCISTHPHRWTNAPLLWTYNMMYDRAGNIAKKLIRMVRGRNAN